MYRKLFLTVLLLIFTKALFAQNVEKQLLGSFCHSLVQRQQWGIIYDSVRKYEVVVLDPVSSKLKIIHATPLPPDLHYFNKYSKKKQIDILQAEPLPVFPLKDTLYIADTLSFFSETCLLKITRHLSLQEK